VAKVTVHAGDWASGSEHSFMFGSFSLRRHGAWMEETVPAANLTRLEVAREDNVKRIGGAAGWGTVGALTLGPVGLFAGLIVGGNKKDVTFVAEFDDGRRMLATTDSKAFTKMQAAIFNRKPIAPSQAQGHAPSPMMEYQRQEDEIAKKLADISGLGLSAMVMDHYEKLLRSGETTDAERFLRDACAPR
jgi:hypothetical protein